jgi:hypothetical protein
MLCCFAANDMYVIHGCAGQNPIPGTLSLAAGRKILYAISLTRLGHDGT